MMPRSRTALAFLLAIAAGALVQFCVFRSQAYSLLGPDFIDYLFQSEEVLGGRFPNIVFKPPGCAFWILMYRAIFRSDLARYPAFCIAAIGLLPLLSGLIGFYFARWTGAILAAAMMLVSPASLYISLLAETPATLFLALAFVAALWSGRATAVAARHVLASASGLLAFLSFQSRPDYVLYLPAIAVVLALDDPARTTLRSTLASPRLLVLGGTWSALLMALLVVSAPRYGTFGPVRYDAYLRYYTAFQDLGLQPPPEEPSVRLIRRSLIEAGVRPERLSGQDDLGFPRGWFVVRAALKESGLTWAQADRIMNSAAISAMRANPKIYLARVAATFADFLLFRPLFASGGAPGRAEPIAVPPQAYARLHALHFDSDSPEYRKAEKMYEELKSYSVTAPDTVPRIRKLQSQVGFLLVYPGIALAMLLLPRRQRWMIGAAAGSVALVFLAYATGGFFSERYLSGHCFVLWSLSMVGYARLVEQIVNRARVPGASIQSRPAGD